MSHYVTYSPICNHFSCFRWPPSCVPSVVSTKIHSHLLPEAMQRPPCSPQDRLVVQDHDSPTISPFRTRVVLVWPRQVDVFPQVYMYALSREWASSISLLRGRSSPDCTWILAHRSIYRISLVLRRGWLLVNLTTHSKRAGTSAVFTYPCSWRQGEVENWNHMLVC